MEEGMCSNEVYSIGLCDHYKKRTMSLEQLHPRWGYLVFSACFAWILHEDISIPWGLNNWWSACLDSQLAHMHDLEFKIQPYFLGRTFSILFLLSSIKKNWGALFTRLESFLHVLGALCHHHLPFFQIWQHFHFCLPKIDRAAPGFLYLWFISASILIYQMDSTMLF